VRLSASGYFSRLSLPQAPEYPIRAILNCYENSRRYSQALTSVNDNGDKLRPVSKQSKKSRARLPLRIPHSKNMGNLEGKVIEFVLSPIKIS
jgi:hypothetical protein